MDEGTQYFTKDDTSGEYVEYTSPTFAERLPEAHRENEAFKGMENLGGLAEAHVNTVKELTDLKSAQPVVPESYTAPKIPEGSNVDDQAITEFTALAKELNITQDAFDRIIAFDLARAERYNGDFERSLEESKLAAENALKERWGTGYETNKEQASAGFRKVLGSFEDGDEIEKSLAKTGFLDNAEFMRLFRRIGEKTGEDVFVRGTQTPASQEMERSKTTDEPLLNYPKSKMPGDS